MTVAPEEIGRIRRAAPTRCWSISAPSTANAARRPRSPWNGGAKGTPWVLDPVFVDRSPAARRFCARRLSARRPAAVRLNHAEFAALGGRAADARSAAALCASNTHCVVALTGRDRSCHRRRARCRDRQRPSADGPRSPPWAAPGRRWSRPASRSSPIALAATAGARFGIRRSPASWRRSARAGRAVSRSRSSTRFYGLDDATLATRARVA